METDISAALHQLQILGTPPEESFDDIVALAVQICETPVAIIAFEDGDRYWFKATQGIEISEISRESAFCAKGINSDGFILISDAKGDPSLAGNPFVSLYGIRAVACLQLLNDEHVRLGYLCVMDYQPRSFTARQLSGMQILARQVDNLLRLRVETLRRRREETRTRDAAEQMNTIFHNSIVGVAVLEDDGKIVQWNPKSEAIFGCSAGEVLGKNFADTFIPDRFRNELEEKMRSYKKTDYEPLLNNSIEMKAIRKNGAEFDVALGISPAIINGHRFFIHFISDITDRVSATKKLDEQKEFYENILNVLPADIAVFDANHKYLFVNPRGIKDPVLRKYIVGKDDFEYAEYRNRDKSVAQIRRDQFMEVKRSGQEIRWEDTVQAPDGTPNTSLRRLFPVFDDYGSLQLVIGFGVDITDRKIMEEKQAAMLSQLSVQNTQLIDFCNIVSHNLRAPLVNMSMLVNFIEETKDREEQEMLISKLQPVIEHLHTTFNELVESIQIKQDHEITSESIELSDCLQRTIDGLKMEINSSHALIQHDFSAAPKVYFPSKYIFSIFHNLVSNALKYQSAKRKPEILLRTERKDESIILSVKDNGQGIDMAKHKDNMFKIGKVFHYHPNAKGFGLFMTKTQVEAMGGSIWVESTPDQGATFFVEFKNQGS